MDFTSMLAHIPVRLNTTSDPKHRLCQVLDEPVTPALPASYPLFSTFWRNAGVSAYAFDWLLLKSVSSARLEVEWNAKLMLFSLRCCMQNPDKCQSKNWHNDHFLFVCLFFLYEMTNMSSLSVGWSAGLRGTAGREIILPVCLLIWLSVWIASGCLSVCLSG